MADEPTLEDRRHWRALGREHGRRAVPSEAGRPNVVADGLRSILHRTVLDARQVALVALEPVDGERRRLRRDATLLAGTSASTPPGADQLAQDLARVEHELATRDVARRTINDRLDLTTRELAERAAQAEAEFREAYVTSTRLKGVEPAPADLDLPADLRGPIPDPLEDP